MIHLKPAEACASEAPSNCWSPGVPDVDCESNGLCCFNGCANRCIKHCFTEVTQECVTTFDDQCDDKPSQVCNDIEVSTPCQQECETVSEQVCEQVAEQVIYISNLCYYYEVCLNGSYYLNHILE